MRLPRLFFCCLLLAVFSDAMAQPDAEFLVAREVLAPLKITYTQPPEKLPSDSATDAPLLGNGDMGVAIGGAPEAQVFYLSKNDFWRLRSKYGESGPRVLGKVNLDIPALKAAEYHLEQQLYEATTVSRFTKDALTFQIRSWVAATENLLALELSVEGGSVAVNAQINAASGNHSETIQDQEGGCAWGTRSFTRGVDIPTAAAAVMKILAHDATSFTVTPEKPVMILVAVESLFKQAHFLDVAKQRVMQTDPVVLRKAHTGWWAAFWAQSLVEVDDPDLMRQYYLSQYVLASCSRDPEFPPGIFGTWVTTDTPAWNGDYHLNYNHMAPYYGLYSSNHIEQADPYHGPILDFHERGRWYAKEARGLPGVYLPVGMGPKGIDTVRGGKHNPEDMEAGALFMQQKSNAAYCVVNLAMRWRATYDLDYARKVYPFVRDVADFWEAYLVYEDGRYVIYNDAVHECSSEDKNSIVSLALVRNVLETCLDMSRELGVDQERHEKWQHILAHLSGFAMQEKDGKTVFRYTEDGTAWWGDNTLGIQHIYPAGAIGLESDPELLKVAHNTIEVMGRWTDFNGTNSFYPAAVRVGYDGEVIYQQLLNYVRNYTNTNGFYKDNPHGIENCSTVPNTINEMLCMGHQGVLRIFPVWPRERNARFMNLRAEGAFLVSSSLKEGLIPSVRITSEQGRSCVLENPWPGEKVRVERSDGNVILLDGSRLSMSTKTGEQLTLSPVK